MTAAIIPFPNLRDRLHKAEAVVTAAAALIRATKRGPDGEWQTTDEAFVGLIEAVNAAQS